MTHRSRIHLVPKTLAATAKENENQKSVMVQRINGCSPCLHSLIPVMRPWMMTRQVLLWTIPMTIALVCHPNSKNMPKFWYTNPPLGKYSSSAHMNIGWRPYGERWTTKSKPFKNSERSLINMLKSYRENSNNRRIMLWPVCLQLGAVPNTPHTKVKARAPLHPLFHVVALTLWGSPRLKNLVNPRELETMARNHPYVPEAIAPSLMTELMPEKAPHYTHLL